MSGCHESGFGVVPATDPNSELDDFLLSGKIADEPSSGVEGGGLSKQLNLGIDLGSTSVDLGFKGK